MSTDLATGNQIIETQIVWESPALFLPRKTVLGKQSSVDALVSGTFL